MSSDAQIMLYIALAGVVGGIINAFLSDNGFLRPYQEVTATGTYWRPGYLGNVLVGTAAALISWGLYGPYATYILLPANTSPKVTLQLSLTNLVGAVLVGVAGSRWLSSQVDKNLLNAAVTVAAANPADPAKAAELAAATPSQKLQIVKDSHGLLALPDQPD